MTLQDLPLKSLFTTRVKYKDKIYVVDDINIRLSKVVMYEENNWASGIVVCLHEDIEVLKNEPSKY